MSVSCFLKMEWKRVLDISDTKICFLECWGFPFAIWPKSWCYMNYVAQRHTNMQVLFNYFLNLTLVFDWCVDRWRSKSNTCLNKIGLCLSMLLTNRHSIVNTISGRGGDASTLNWTTHGQNKPKHFKNTWIYKAKQFTLTIIFSKNVYIFNKKTLQLLCK